MRRHLRSLLFGNALVGLVFSASSAFGQAPPPLPPPDPPPPGSPTQEPVYAQPQPYPAQPTYQEPARPPPPAFEYHEPEMPTHAPKYSLWVGARVSYMGFGFSFFGNETGRNETTGNFIGNGVAPQFEIGARISHRYVPYIFFEHGFMSAGHRFEGDNASASTNFYGVGFRYVSGDADSVAFLTDLSIGKREIRVSSNGETYVMSGLEIFKIGLGAEIRLSTLFTLEPLISVSTGVLNDTEGTVHYSAEGSKDGLKEPRFRNGNTIDDSRQYVLLGLGVGGHFDVFGK